MVAYQKFFIVLLLSFVIILRFSSQTYPVFIYYHLNHDMYIFCNLRLKYYVLNIKAK